MESTTRENKAELIRIKSSDDTLKASVRTYLLNPLSAGMVGFSILFSIILVTKLVGFVIGSYDTFSIGVADVVYSLIGFLLVTGEKFLKFFVKEES
ncbi:MAG: hypothetical protein R3250_00310 [Melioribacteraceae bacterium]|nr:hypothetical protein [Melioribacteraceae bacterium]